MLIYKKKKPLIQDWVFYLHPLAQSNLLKSIRGVDVKIVNDKSKNLVKFIRRSILTDNNNYLSSFYATDKGVGISGAFKMFIENIEFYPLHFVIHLREAVQIIAYTHPDKYIRERFLVGEQRLAKAMASLPIDLKTLNKKYGTLNKKNKKIDLEVEVFKGLETTKQVGVVESGNSISTY